MANFGWSDFFIFLFFNIFFNFSLTVMVINNKEEGYRGVIQAKKKIVENSKRGKGGIPRARTQVKPGKLIFPCHKFQSRPRNVIFRRYGGTNFQNFPLAPTMVAPPVDIISSPIYKARNITSA